MMDLLMGIATCLAIVAIVAVVAGIIAFVGHMIIGVFDKDRTATTSNNEVLDYNQFKQLENTQEATKEYDFEAINTAKAEQEKELAGKDEDDAFKLLDDEDDTNPEEMEKKLVEAKETKKETETTTTETDEDVDELDLDNLLDEISNDVEDEVKAENTEEVKMSDELESYSIDDILNQVNEESEETTETTETTEETAVEPEAEQTEEVEETTTEEVVEPVVDEASQEEIKALRAQVEELNKKLNEKTTRTTVTVDMTEEECLARLATLEERLKTAKKDYRINQKEYRPLKKIMNELERNQVKLRRKDAVVAKQKVALYGVNNYVDIDKEKAEKLANELELLDGLRLSVQHCEEVIAANKDRYPILEHTNAILEEQIANLESDIEATKLTLEKIREKEGKGGNK